MINLFYIEHDAEWQAWIDVKGNPRNGVCLGDGATKTEALFKASLALQGELNVIRELLRNQNDLEPESRATQSTTGAHT